MSLPMQAVLCPVSGKITVRRTESCHCLCKLCFVQFQAKLLYDVQRAVRCSEIREVLFSLPVGKAVFGSQ